MLCVCVRVHGAAVPAVAPKKKKPLSQIIQEKEERRRRELEEKRAREEGQRATLTPEEERAERLRQQRMQEEADLQLAKEAFGQCWSSPLRLVAVALLECMHCFRLSARGVVQELGANRSSKGIGKIVKCGVTSGGCSRTYTSSHDDTLTICSSS